MLVLRIFINEEESEIWDAEEFLDKDAPINLIDSLSVFFEHHGEPGNELLFKFEEMSEDQYNALLDEWDGIPLPIE